MRNELTFLNTSGGLKLFGRIICEERGVLWFEWAAENVKSAEIEAAKQVDNLILKLAPLGIVDSMVSLRTFVVDWSDLSRPLPSKSWPFE